MKYRKKPVVIEAVQFVDNVSEVINFVGAKNLGIIGDQFIIQTLEGDMLASKGDFIIKGVNGEFYPCKSDIFKTTYTDADMPTTSLNELSIDVHKNAVEHGWWDSEREIGTILMLIVTELAETMEEHRNGFKPNEVYYSGKTKEGEAFTSTTGTEICKKPEGIPIELADAVIRILDYCGKEGIDLDRAISIKHEYNKTRPYKHGGKQV